MGKKVVGTTMLREALKNVIGKDRYKDLVIYTDKLKTGYKLKVQQVSWANITGEEVTKIVQYVKDTYNKQVTVKEGCSGTRVWVKYVAFYI